MKRRLKASLAAIAAVVLLGFPAGHCVYSQSGTKAVVVEEEATKGMGEGFSYNEYAAVLSSYVNDRGMVDYKGLKTDRAQLDSFAASLGALDPASVADWSEDQKIALWVNAYNAFTLIAIIDDYPIQSTFIGRRLYPANSIRQIGGVWDELTFRLMGRDMTLDEIEHENLRKDFNEPRIHMALVCAAMGCPPLRNEPYTGVYLDPQLTDQTNRFLANPEKFRIDREEKRVYLSAIFKWFGKDFVETYGNTSIVSGDKTEKAVLNFVSGYLGEADRNFIETQEYDIEYLRYDWSLNEQEG
jgi:hypothetical protein